MTTLFYNSTCIFYFQRWVRAFCHEISVHTTNSVERQNEELKYNFLAKYRDKSLNGLLSVSCFSEFLPDKYARYMYGEQTVPKYTVYFTCCMYCCKCFQEIEVLFSDIVLVKVYQRLSFTYMANSKCQIQVENFAKQKMSG